MTGAMRLLRLVALTLSAAAGCAGGPASPAPPPPAASGASVAPAPAISSAPPAETAAKRPEPCGELGCLLFDTTEDAFSEVLRSQPRILAVGETHAQKGTEGIPSTTARFTERLLPMLAPRATDLLLELWIADGKCGKAEKQVAAAQKPVTAPQAETNQNEFVTLGQKSKSLGIEPHVLKPSCEEYDRIVRAGPDGAELMLPTIARITAAMAKRFLDQNQASPDKLLVAYGGLMHNDLSPRAGRESWSFGPELQAATGGKYVELDLVVPEYIKDEESWRAFPWYAHFDRSARHPKATLFHPQPASYVLIFPSAR